MSSGLNFLLFCIFLQIKLKRLPCLWSVYKAVSNYCCFQSAAPTDGCALSVSRPNKQLKNSWKAEGPLNTTQHIFFVCNIKSDVGIK